MIAQINSNKPTNQLIEELIEKNIEVGMVEFTIKEDFLSIPKTYKKIGNFELDILAIEIKNKEIVVLDYSQTDFVMGNVAKNLAQLVEALKPIEKFFEAAILDDNICEDEETMNTVSTKASNIAGGSNYLWFYRSILGI